jgi:hypothetical protein
MKVQHAKHLDKQDHRLLALWAADCAEHVLPFFEEHYPEDDRPRKAIEAGRAWARGEIACGAARAAAYAVKAATAAAIHTSTGAASAKEHDCQCRRLPEHLRPAAFPDRGINTFA